MVAGVSLLGVFAGCGGWDMVAWDWLIGVDAGNGCWVWLLHVVVRE